MQKLDVCLKRLKGNDSALFSYQPSGKQAKVADVCSDIYEHHAWTKSLLNRLGDMDFIAFAMMYMPPNRQVGRRDVHFKTFEAYQCLLSVRYDTQFAILKFRGRKIH